MRVIRGFFAERGRGVVTSTDRGVDAERNLE
jgi:hypothetical protein